MKAFEPFLFLFRPGKAREKLQCLLYGIGIVVGILLAFFHRHFQSFHNFAQYETIHLREISVPKHVSTVG
jgi:hypothetical protein